MTLIDWSLVALYFLIAIAIGVFYRQQAGKNIEEYLIKGYVSGWLSAALTPILGWPPEKLILIYGCHPTALGPENRLASADYPGAAMLFVERTFGEGTVAMFTNGGGGNVNPLDTGPFEIADRLGQQLGTEVVNLVSNKGDELNPELKVANETADLPFSYIPTIDESEQLINKYSEAVKSSHLGSVGRKISEAGLAWAMKLKADIQDANIPSKLTVQVQRVMLGGVALVAIPAEVFAETAMSIKRKWQGGAIVLSYGNGDVGYLPTGGEIGKGGYEVLEAHKYYGYCSHVAPEAEENVRKAALGLRKLK